MRLLLSNLVSDLGVHRRVFLVTETTQWEHVPMNVQSSPVDDAEAVLRLPGDRSFVLVVGDLFAQEVDAIVNAANGQLAHGGGVAGLIAQRAGEALVRESRARVSEHGAIPVGTAVVTTAGELPFQGVIHAVGPRQGEGDERAKLESAVVEALNRADEEGWRSVALPAVSSGIFAVPPEVCAPAYVAGAVRHLHERPESVVEEVRLCLLNGPLVELVRVEMERAGEARDDSDEHHGTKHDEDE